MFLPEYLQLVLAFLQCAGDFYQAHAGWHCLRDVRINLFNADSIPNFRKYTDGLYVDFTQNFFLESKIHGFHPLAHD